MTEAASAFGAAVYTKMPKTTIPWPTLTTIRVLEFPVIEETTTAIRMLLACTWAQAALNARAGTARLATELIAT